MSRLSCTSHPSGVALGVQCIQASIRPLTHIPSDMIPHFTPHSFPPSHLFTRTLISAFLSRISLNGSEPPDKGNRYDELGEVVISSLAHDERSACFCEACARFLAVEVW